MEMMEGGELFHRISQHRHFTEKMASQVTKQVAEDTRTQFKSSSLCYDVSHKFIRSFYKYVYWVLLHTQNTKLCLIPMSLCRSAKPWNIVTPWILHIVTWSQRTCFSRITLWWVATVVLNVSCSKISHRGIAVRRSIFCLHLSEIGLDGAGELKNLICICWAGL